jgi:hypothetical protein
LVVGAALPDLVYVAGCCAPPQTYGHSWWATFAGIPVTLVLSRLIRRAAPVVAAHLPPLGPLALTDYGALGVVRHRWWISVLSAWLGAFSHVLWDHLTHASIAGTDLGLPALDAEVVDGIPWWMPLHLLSSALGVLAWLATTIHIGRHRLLVRWHGPPPSVAVRPRRFWGIAAGAGLGGAVCLALLVAAASVRGAGNAGMTFREADAVVGRQDDPRCLPR